MKLLEEGNCEKARDEDVSEGHTEFWGKGQLCLDFPPLPHRIVSYLNTLVVIGWADSWLEHGRVGLA